MKILIISDIHQRVSAVQQILDAQQDNVDHIIFLGDYFDNFPNTLDIAGISEMCEWLKATADDLKDKATWLCGNHDIQYFEEAYRVGNTYGAHRVGKKYVCSGYSANKAMKIKKHFGYDKHNFFKQMQLSVTMEGFTFSHGGFHIDKFNPELTLTDNVQNWNQYFKDAIEHISSPMPSRIYECGSCRGGSENIGGPLWLDFNQEFMPIDDLPQIVGHTPHTYPSRNGNSVCLDCFNEYYAIAEDGIVDLYHANGDLYDESA